MKTLSINIKKYYFLLNADSYTNTYDSSLFQSKLHLSPDV